MVFLTRLDGSELVVNAEHLLTVERTPDTVVTLTTGARLMVNEDVAIVVDRFIAYRRQCLAGLRYVEPAPEPEIAPAKGRG